MRTLRLLAIAGALALLCSLVALIPARIVLPLAGVPPAAAVDVSGTIWNGFVRRLTLDGIQLDGVRWRFRPLRLLAGQAAASLEAQLPGGFAAGQIALSPGGTLAASDVELAAPLALLAPAAGPLGPGGQVTARFDRLVLAGGQIRAAVGTLQVAGIVLPVAAGKQLGAGSYAITFAAEEVPPGQPLTGAFKDTGGPVQIEGTLTLTPPRSYELAGQAKARPGAPDSVRDALQMLGPASPDGSHQISLAGSY